MRIEIALFLCLNLGCGAAPMKSVPPAPSFCHTGVAWPTDLNGAAVRVTLMEAPLFSLPPDSPLPGEILHAYHTALFFEVDRSGGQPPVYYTLEYDAALNIAKAAVPKIDAQGNITWNNDARYCLTEGLLHNRSHWRKQFSNVANITGSHFARLGTEFITAANGSTTNEYSLNTYELVQVVSKKATKLLFHDVTCATGATAALAWLAEHCNTSFASVAVSSSHLALHTETLRVVDASNATEMDDVRAFYGQMSDAVHNPEHKGVIEHLRMILKLLKDWNYVYRDGVYYKLQGKTFPYASMEYKATPYGLYASSLGRGKGASWITELKSGGPKASLSAP